MNHEIKVFFYNNSDVYEYKVMRPGDMWYAYRNKEYIIEERLVDFVENGVSTITYKVKSRAIPLQEWKSKKKKGFFDLPKEEEKNE